MFLHNEKFLPRFENILCFLSQKVSSFLPGNEGNEIKKVIENLV